MQVSYKIVSTDPTGYVLLFDESKGDSLEVDKGSFKGLVQKENLAFGSAPARFPRGNVTSSWTLKWASVYASSAAARSAVATLGMLKLEKMHLKIVDGATTQYLPNAIADTYEYDHQGRSVTHSFNFEGDDLATTEPA